MSERATRTGMGSARLGIVAIVAIAVASGGCAMTQSTGKDDTGKPVDSNSKKDEPAKPALGSADGTMTATKAAVTASRPAAEAGVQTLKEMADAARHASLGFDSVEEAKSAALGEGLAVVHIRLDQLAAWSERQDLYALLQPVERVLWTVTAGNAARSSVTTESKAGRWTASRFGGKNTLRAVGNARSAARTASAKVTVVAEYLVSIPALNQLLVAEQEQKGDVTLTATTDDAALGIQAGKTVAWREMLPRLAKGAKEHDGRLR